MLSWHSPDLAVIPQPVLQSSKYTCNCPAVPNLAVINLAVINLAILGSCSHEILQSQILQSRSKIPTCEILQSWHSPDLAVIPQPVLQSTKWACCCLVVPNLAVLNLAVIHLAVRKPTLLGSCSHEILQLQILQSRSKILVPLVRSCSRVTVQTLQSSQQSLLQSSNCTCNCLAVPNLAVRNLAVIHLAVRKPTLLGSCSHEILQSNCSALLRNSWTQPAVY